MASTASASDALAALNRLVENAIALLVQLEAVTTAISQGNDAVFPSIEPKAAVQDSSPASPNALTLARDAAVLIKAHSTKISLFIINEPFTPTAISKVLQELIIGPVPALASAAQLCTAAQYTLYVRKRLAWRCAIVLREVKTLLHQIPHDGRVLAGSKKDGASTGGADGAKGSIATTGLIWTACDEVVELAKAGVDGCLIAKVEECRATLKDVLDELKEWSEETSDEDDEGEDGDDNSESTALSGDEADDVIDGRPSAHAAAQAMLDELMADTQRIPRGDPDKIRERLDVCLRRLRLVTILYQAIVKRRLSTLPALPSAGGESQTTVASRLNEALPLVTCVPETFTSLALAFYELDTAEIDRLMNQGVLDCVAVSEQLAKPWLLGEEGLKDEFGDWVTRFQTEIRKA
jgi:hypothetical protein